MESVPGETEQARSSHSANGNIMKPANNLFNINQEQSCFFHEYVQKHKETFEFKNEQKFNNMFIKIVNEIDAISARNHQQRNMESPSHNMEPSHHALLKDPLYLSIVNDLRNFP
ncbi:unnamed protein product [Adineta steineri]|uniref:Uncharacterized protein n=1 Tax=Adineta steineri TaxID=433720 RepID=A0A814PJV0_9BILA|nr:unnamed protein product [Adineta steineri]CAF1107010.1 unnamed protein product [Adineta steineri]CAF1209681.1 unnamed protein product [Adineta steineri]